MILNEPDEPPSMNESRQSTRPDSYEDTHKKQSFISRILGLLNPKQDTTLRETIEEYINEEEQDGSLESSISEHERDMISNILNLNNISVSNVMVPRADIIAISDDTTQTELFSLLAEKQFSRIPVYKDTLDQVIGAIHIKDILETLAKGNALDIKNIIRDIPIISPSMHVLDLLLEMRMTRKHMALIVDEFGGIDGLITIGDVLEAIIGEIDDEHDPDDDIHIIHKENGNIIVDARLLIQDFEEEFGALLREEERNESDTLGGLVFDLCGRVPARGELIAHESGMVFEVLEADPRRIQRLCIRDIPKQAS